ncbi:DUF6417 family protein [Streptomyces sp. NBC_01615]|uniref:DUF6417 family protein n=1 Tax=Streptomyces sp. NBC_01615 TaxID=2975898 RepID=UPI00386FDE35
MESVAYGLWLHRMTGAAAEANRFAREYGAVHSPSPAERDGLSPGADTLSTAPAWCRGLEREGDVDGLVGAASEALGEHGLFGGDPSPTSPAQLNALGRGERRPVVGR